MFANAHLLLNKLRFAAELKNKNLRFLQAVSSYAKLSVYEYREIPARLIQSSRGVAKDADALDSINLLRRTIFGLTPASRACRAFAAAVLANDLACLNYVLRVMPAQAVDFVGGSFARGLLLDYR